MPEMGGPECAARLWEQRGDLPVLFMSGYADQPLGGGGALEPGAALVQKPFELAELAARVRQALDGG
jgi:FixJ family two-component response regulator